MRKIAGFLVGVLVSLAASGQDLLQCVNPDVRNGLLFSGHEDGRIEVMPSLPEALAGFEAPAEFSLIGTGVRDVTTAVAYRTGLDTAGAYRVMLDALIADGWVLKDEPVPSRPVFFVNEAPAASSAAICRDDAPGSRFSVHDLVDHRYVTINLGDQPQTGGCDDYNPRNAFTSMRVTTRLYELAPFLRLPDGTTAADGSVNLGAAGSVSGTTMSTSLQVRSTATPVEFMAFLAEQMSAQGWQTDSRWSGSVSHGSSWTKKGSDGLPYWSTVELVDIGDGRYDLSYRGT